MNIGLDWDGTCSADPDAWYRVAKTLESFGHTVYVVTMRYESEEDGGPQAGPIDARFKQFTRIFTDREAKRPACESVGIQIDVWVDDNPRAVNESAFQIWGDFKPEGQPVDPAFKEQA